MSGKKRIIVLGALLVLAAAAWVLINIAVDPFGVFGDKLLKWDSYNMTTNTKTGKFGYLKGHLDDYDGYIIGGAGASSLDTETLGGYLDADFYNAFIDESDSEYYVRLTRWLLENDGDVRYIVLALDIDDAAAQPGEKSGLKEKYPAELSDSSAVGWYAGYLFANPRYCARKLVYRYSDTELPQYFDAFDASTGCCDTRITDSQSIGSLNDYLAENGGFYVENETDLSYAEACAENVAAIRELCGSAGVELYVMFSPASREQIESCDSDRLDQYFELVAAETDCWNFCISSVSCDERYFYNAYRARTDAGNMALAAMFGDDDAYFPEDFGEYSGDGFTSAEDKLTAAEGFSGVTSVSVPVLMYHDIDDVGDDGCTVSIGSFRRQLELIKENGYTPISLQQLLDYVETGADLPESPVVITFDDGYYSNYQYALPVLEEYQYPAAIFVIGTSFGHMQYYKDTEYTLTPHFGASEAAEMLDSGLITLQSHTYDMHQWAPYETGDTVRENMLKLDSDSESSYISAVTEDLAAERALLKDAGVGSIFAAAYPSGLHETLTEATLAENGIKITFTVDNTRENVVVKGLSQSLYGLGRLNMNETLSDESLLNYLAGK